MENLLIIEVKKNILTSKILQTKYFLQKMSNARKMKSEIIDIDKKIAEANKKGYGDHATVFFMHK